LLCCKKGDEAVRAAAPYLAQRRFSLGIGHWALVIGAARGRLGIARVPVGFRGGNGLAEDLYNFLALFARGANLFRSEQLRNHELSLSGAAVDLIEA
jgi:hypothetical protein